MSKRKTPCDSVLVKEVKNGMNATTISRKYGVSKVCVARHLKRLGLSAESPIGKKGNQHSQWKGGRSLKSNYWTVYAPEHPRVLNNNRVFEHILVAEKKYGRSISKGQPIHHIDFNRQNNDPNNLYLCESHMEHKNIHCRLEDVARELYHRGVIGFKNGNYYLA
jgi:hypothetical protein